MNEGTGGAGRLRSLLNARLEETSPGAWIAPAATLAGDVRVTIVPGDGPPGG